MRKNRKKSQVKATVSVAQDGGAYNLTVSGSDADFSVSIAPDKSGLCIINGVRANGKQLIDPSNVEFAIAVPGNWVPSHNNQNGVTTVVDKTASNYANTFTLIQDYEANQLSPAIDSLWKGRLMHVVTAGKIDIYHSFEFIKDTRINVGYLAMLPMSSEVNEIQTSNNTVSHLNKNGSNIQMDKDLHSAVVDYGDLTVTSTTQTILDTTGAGHSDDYDSFIWDRAQPASAKLYWRTWKQRQTVLAGTSLSTHQTLSISKAYA